MWASYLTKIPYIRVSAGSLGPEKKASPVSTETTLSSPKPASYRTWSLVVWPLIVHALMAVGIAAIVIIYVDHRDFNLERRRPFVKLEDGTMVPWVHYSPLQTDITTALSIMLAVLRLITACWLGPLSWRCAFVLMEEFGLRPRQLHILVSYGISVTPLSGTPRKDKRILQFIVCAVLLVVLPVHLAAPVLTGSIAWVSSNPPPEQLSNSTISTWSSTSYDIWNPDPWVVDRSTLLRLMIEAAATRPFMTWGRDTSNVALKRFIPEFSELDINSTVANVTLPYFTVQSIEWIDNPNSTLSSDQLDILKSVCPKVNMTGPDCPIANAYRALGPRAYTNSLAKVNMTGPDCPIANAYRALGPRAYTNSLALVPDTRWTYPSTQPPSMVKERRLMVYPSPGDWSSSGEWECLQGGELNPNVSADSKAGCWKFAWVTYSAGAAICYNCRVSSYATVQNDTALVLQEAYMTAEALRMMPSVIGEMLSSNDAVECGNPPVVSYRKKVTAGK
ncbi:hypothetical protein RSAG8_12294, partial [Rhizoctonia solani AG-8 WAC10335]